MEHAHEAAGAARGPAGDIDEQILVMWRALRANPSLDARWAMQVIDRLLDQRIAAEAADRFSSSTTSWR